MAHSEIKSCGEEIRSHDMAVSMRNGASNGFDSFLSECREKGGRKDVVNVVDG